MVDQKVKGALFAKFELSQDPAINPAEREELKTLTDALEEIFSDPRYQLLGEFDGDEWDLKDGSCTLYFYGEVDSIQRVLEALVEVSPFVGRVELTKYHGEDRDHGTITRA